MTWKPATFGENAKHFGRAQFRNFLENAPTSTGHKCFKTKSFSTVFFCADAVRREASENDVLLPYTARLRFYFL